MANYSKTTNFTAKDSLATGNSAKVVKGGEVDIEFNAIQNAIGTKVDQVSVSNTRLLVGDGSGGFADSEINANAVADLVTSGVLPAGTILMWGAAAAPAGYLLCNGTAYSRSVYDDLFAAIGVTYGSGDGSTTFNVPDMTGRMAIMAGDSGETGDTAKALGDSGGEAKHTLTVAEIPSHTHNYTAMFYNNNIDGVDSTGLYTFEHRLKEQASSAVGGGGAHNILNPYMTVNFIIKA